MKSYLNSIITYTLNIDHNAFLIVSVMIRSIWIMHWNQCTIHLLCCSQRNDIGIKFHPFGIHTFTIIGWNPRSNNKNNTRNNIRKNHPLFYIFLQVSTCGLRGTKVAWMMLQQQMLKCNVVIKKKYYMETESNGGAGIWRYVRHIKIYKLQTKESS